MGYILLVDKFKFTSIIKLKIISNIELSFNMSEQTRDTLLDSLAQYENQLAQIKLAALASPAGKDRDNLYNLQKDIEELILLTQENLSRLNKVTDNAVEEEDELSKEYALFKEELAELDFTESSTSRKEDNEEETDDIGPDIENELESLKGSKCQAPHKQKWGDVSYHNSLIVGVEVSESPSAMDHIEVRVLFVNPTEKDMLPCPYYLDGECKFSDEQCHFSHGELVPLSDIKEYREPDFGCIKEGCSVLAKHKDKLWKRARVMTIIDDNQCKVKFDSGGYTADVDLHELLPLDDKNHGSSGESSDSSLSEVDEESEHDKLVQLSLLRTPASRGLGEWEKHTKGIGSRLMASMGYISGMGLGKHGEGRLEPVEAVVFPPGKSLDHCMALREASGGDPNLFKAARKHRKQQQQELKRRKKEYEKETTTDVFGFINTKLAGPSTSADTSNHVDLVNSSSKGLNVERFKLGEDIRRTEKDVAKLKESLKRHDKGTVSHNTLSSKLQQTQNYLSKLQNSEKSIVREQDQRQNRKKLAVF